MKRLLLILCLLAPPVWANQLTLEFAQEGEPSQPRALVVIHNAFESRENLKPFLTAWANGSWGRDQYCSVYVYEYDANGTRDLPASETLAQDLYARIRSDNFESGEADDINPARRTAPSDSRQPAPDLKAANLQLLLAGSGYGGLVARRVCLLAKADEHPVHRVGYLGTPLDGLSTIDLILATTTKERAPLVGLSNALSVSEVENLSAGWWSLTALFDELGEWQTLFAPAYQEVKMVAAYGATPLLPHPTDNVLLGRYRPGSHSSTDWNDGLLPRPMAWGARTGPLTFLTETTLTGTSQADLTEKGSDPILKTVLDRPVIFSYLARRETIEEMIKAKVGGDPLYMYWDERDSDGYTPQWRGAYASKKGLYEMMWGVGL